MSPATVAAGAALGVAVISGAISAVSNARSIRAASSVQDLKSGIDRDLERLKAKLEHGQLISSTQWQAEFAAYQALWKAVVPVRARALKLVSREYELAVLGIKEEELPKNHREEQMQRLLQSFAEDTRNFMLVVNEHAPFYLSTIREKANMVHQSGHKLVDSFNAKLLTQIRNRDSGKPIVSPPTLGDVQEVTLLAEGVDALENLIRARLSEVQVLNHVRPY